MEYVIGSLVVAWAVYVIAQGYLDEVKPTTKPVKTRASADSSKLVQLKVYTTRKEAEQDCYIKGHGRFDQEVVGESHYQDILNIISTSMPDEYKFVQATLEMEPSNPHDKNAVAVKIAGQTVGYLPRDAAKEYQKKAKTEHIPPVVTCPAMITGGGDAFYGVRLGMPELVD